MKRWLLLGICFVAIGCKDRPATPPPPKAEPEGVDAIQSPTIAPPPVQALSYEAGYSAGDTDGDAAAQALKTRHSPKPEVPSDEQLDVLALKAAGDDPKRGPKWQHGYAEGYRDAFQHRMDGRK